MTLRELPGGGALGAVRHHRAGLLPAQQPKPIADRGLLQGAEKIVTSRLLSDWGIPELTCCRGLLGPRGHIPPPHTHLGSYSKGLKHRLQSHGDFRSTVMAPTTADTKTFASGPSSRKPRPEPLGCRTQTRQQAQGQAWL